MSKLGKNVEGHTLNYNSGDIPGRHRRKVGKETSFLALYFSALPELMTKTGYNSNFKTPTM